MYLQLAIDAKIWSSGPHSDPVYLAGLHCQGTETNLAQCARDNWSDDRCSGYHGYAGVICASENTPGRYGWVGSNPSKDSFRIKMSPNIISIIRLNIVIILVTRGPKVHLKRGGGNITFFFQTKKLKENLEGCPIHSANVACCLSG